MHSLLVIASALTLVQPSMATDYTVDTAVQKTLAHSPAVRLAKERLAETDSARSQAFASVLPTLTSGLSFLYRKDASNNANVLFGGEGYNQYDARLFLTQPVYTGGALGAAMAALGTEREIRDQDLRIAERDATVQALQAFYATIYQKEIIERLLREKERLEQYLGTAQRRYREGTSRVLEVLQIKTQLALLLPKISRAESDLQLRTAELAYLMDESQAKELGVSGTLDPIDWTKLAAQSSSKASRIAELARARLLRRKLDETTTGVLAKHLPGVGIEANWGRSSFVKADLLDDFSTSWAVGLKVTIPLFSGLSSIHERRVLSSQATQLEVDEARIREKFSLDQIRAEKEVRLAQTIFETNRTALNLAREALKEATSTHRLGTSTYVQLFESQKNFTEAELAFAQAKYGYVLAQTLYFAASGWELSELVAALAAGGRR